MGISTRCYWLAFAMLAGFIGWIIYQADTGEKIRLFLLVESFPLGDKLGHLWLYGALAFLLNLSLKLRKYHFHYLSIYRGSLFVLVFAIAEELSQQFFVTRTLDAGDLIADAIGIAIAEFLLRRKPAQE
ncbi:MAG: hypothetical protein B0W54_00315 [Cellvibrio sp. 79]|nr:MAG: hypothetical protein B0W54_00315 [Cellvibrio sp. 79]